MNYMIQRKKEFRNPRCVSHEPAGLVELLMLDQGLRCPMDVARRDPARIPPEPKGTISQSAIPAGHLPFPIQAEHKPVCGVGAKRPGLEWGPARFSSPLCS